MATVHNLAAAPSSEKPVVNKPAVKCLVCERQQSLKNCYKFKDLPYWQRKDFLRAELLCFECYEEGHLCICCPRRRESKESNNGPNPVCARQALQLAKGIRPTNILGYSFYNSK